MRKPVLLAALVLLSSFAAACSSSPTSPSPSKLRPVGATMDGAVDTLNRSGYTNPGG